MTRINLAKAAKSTKTPAIDLMIIKIISMAMLRGDHTRLNFLLDRTIGKVKENVEVSNPDGSMQGTIIMLPSNGREKINE